MDILAKVPAMPDDALGNLRANAERLALKGRPQRSQAAALIPALEAELSGRQAAKLERTARARSEAAALRASHRKADGHGGGRQASGRDAWESEADQPEAEPGRNSGDPQESQKKTP